MKRNGEPPVQRTRVRDGQRGQSLILVASLLVACFAAAAISIDFGYVYSSYEQLVGLTNAAALAGGAAIPQGNAQTVAYQYSGWSNAPVSGIHNIQPYLNITNVTSSLTCVQPSTYPSLGLPLCATYSVAQGNINVIQVTETATVPTFFAKIFGVNSVPISATATASAKGGGAPPYHIVMILDSTPSMLSVGKIDQNCLAGNPSLLLAPEQCAEEGIQTLLTYLDPCATTLTSCGTASNGLYPNSIDEVALMSFPGLTPAENKTFNNPPIPAPTASDYTTCPPGNPSISYYNNNPGYLVLPFQSNYRVSDTAALNLGTSGSNLLKSVGAVTNGTCDGIDTPGINAVNQSGTFYAGVIDAAQAYLAANSTPNVKNVIVLLSDGDAASNTTSMGGTAGGPNGVYPHANQCQQAITRANVAKAAGTLVYSVSYGSETTGCSTDSPAITPCQTMEQISSSPTGGPYFFSIPYSNGTGTVCSGAQPITALYQVFTTIAGDLTNSRLIPNSTF